MLRGGRRSEGGGEGVTRGEGGDEGEGPNLFHYFESFPLFAFSNSRLDSDARNNMIPMAKTLASGGQWLRFMFRTPGPASYRRCKVLMFLLTIERVSTISIIAERILRPASSQSLLRVDIDGLMQFEVSFFTYF